MFGRFALTSLAVITGASGGVGTAVARRLASEVDVLVLIGRDPARLEAAAPHGAAAELIVADVVDNRTPALVAGGLAGHAPERVVLVNAAGRFGPVESLETTSMEDWARTLEVHVVGAAAMMQAVLPWMRGSGWGRIINVSSAQSLHGPDGAASAYATAKAAQNVLTASLALELDGTEIASCAIHPGDLDTRMAEDIRTKARCAGAIADHLAAWGAAIGAEGGDDLDAVGDLVVEIIERPARWSNGRFLLAKSAHERHPTEGWSMPVGPWI